MSSIHLAGVTKRYGDFVAVDNVDLEIGEGEFITMLGASGSGKTTCLRMIAGFVAPTSGRVHIGAQDVTQQPPYRRNAGMVFQQYALFPHLTVAENVAYGLKVRRVPRGDIATRVTEALRLVRMEAFTERLPAQLSGGQKQRVALARAVVIRPQVLLLDEPLGALDLKLREELQTEIKRVQQAVGITTVFVTHDQGEALSLSDRVVVMAQGKILQVDAPCNLYQRPRSRYVASFIGRMNFLDVAVHARSDDRDHHTVGTPGDVGECFQVHGGQSSHFDVGESCVLAFRPEDVRLGAVDGNVLLANVAKVTYLGDNWSITCAGPNDTQIAVALARGQAIPGVGDAVTLGWRPESSMLLKRD